MSAVMAPGARPVLVGARGWRHPGWSGVFYPRDLPRPWRLSWYANEFPVLLVPARDLRALTREAAELDARNPLRLVLELSDEPRRLRRTLGGLGALRRRVCAVLLRPAARPAAPARLRGALHGLPAFRCAADGAVQALGAEGRGAAGAPLRLVDGLSSLRHARHLIEALAALDDAPVPRSLFLTGSPPAVPRLRELRTLAELLGH